MVTKLSILKANWFEVRSLSWAERAQELAKALTLYNRGKMADKKVGKVCVPKERRSMRFASKRDA